MTCWATPWAASRASRRQRRCSTAAATGDAVAGRGRADSRQAAASPRARSSISGPPQREGSACSRAAAPASTPFSASRPGQAWRCLCGRWRGAGSAIWPDRRSRPLTRGPEDAHVAQVQLEIAQARRQQALHADLDDLGVGLGGGRADELHAGLKELALAARLGLVVAEDVGEVAEAQGAGLVGQLGARQPRHLGGDVGPQGQDGALAVQHAVEVGLLVGAIAAEQDVVVLVGGGDDLGVAPAGEDLAPGVAQGGKAGGVFEEEIAYAVGQRRVGGLGAGVMRQYSTASRGWQGDMIGARSAGYRRGGGEAGGDGPCQAAGRAYRPALSFHGAAWSCPSRAQPRPTRSMAPACGGSEPGLVRAGVV